MLLSVLILCLSVLITLLPILNSSFNDNLVRYKDKTIGFFVFTLLFILNKYEINETPSLLTFMTGGIYKNRKNRLFTKSMPIAKYACLDSSSFLILISGMKVWWEPLLFTTKSVFYTYPGKSWGSAGKQRFFYMESDFSLYL